MLFHGVVGLVWALFIALALRCFVVCVVSWLFACFFSFVCFGYVDCCVVCSCVIIGVAGNLLMLFDCTFCLVNGSVPLFGCVCFVVFAVCVLLVFVVVVLLSSGFVLLLLCWLLL